jgi:hypothetical protein
MCKEVIKMTIEIKPIKNKHSIIGDNDCATCTSKECELCSQYYSLYIDGEFEGNYDSQIEAFAFAASKKVEG